MWQEVDAAGAVTTRRWDTSGRLLAEFAPGGGVTRIERDGRGAPVSVTGPDGSVTRVTCDAAGRPVRVVDGAGRAEEFAYDVSGNVIEHRAAAGAVTVQAWSPGGESLERVYPDGSSERAVYDDEGLLVAEVGAAGESPGASGDCLKRTPPELWRRCARVVCRLGFGRRHAAAVPGQVPVIPPIDPLVHPARPRRHVRGVGDPEPARGQRRELVRD